MNTLYPILAEYAQGKHRYLEIGVRRGKSLEQVLGVNPGLREYWGVDTFNPNYKDEFPDPVLDFDHIEILLDEMRFHGKRKYFQLDSKEVLPGLPDNYFDLILVDGDHSLRGALTDLLLGWQKLQRGGVLIFDDLVHPAHGYLMDVALAVTSVFDGEAAMSDDKDVIMWTKA